MREDNWKFPRERRVLTLRLPFQEASQKGQNKSQITREAENKSRAALRLLRSITQDREQDESAQKSITPLVSLSHP